MKKDVKKAASSPKTSHVVTDSFPKGKDMLIKWPELGNKGVIVGDIKMPEAIMEDEYTTGMFSSGNIVTGGIFVDMAEQQIWPIRYSADTVNVTEFIPGGLNITDRIKR